MRPQWHRLRPLLPSLGAWAASVLAIYALCAFMLWRLS